MLMFTTVERVGKNSYTIDCFMNDDGTVSSFQCGDLDYLKVKTLDEIMKAMKKKEYDDKRGFVNAKAYMVRSSYNEKEKVVEVTVTSVRDSKTAWVSYGAGQRGTEGLHRLYASRDLLQAAIEVKKKMLRDVQTMFAEIPLWKPVYKQEKA